MAQTKINFDNCKIAYKIDKRKKKKACSIFYKGALAENGADSIYIHYGYGKSWDDADTQKMEFKKSQGIFSYDVDLKEDPIYFCFKDENENWDNNGEKNYTI